MIYSVWNQPNRSYDYYETGIQQLGANTPSPTHIKRSDLGVPVDQVGWPLPPNSTKVGSGDIAKGRIASLPKHTGLGDVSFPKSSFVFVAIGVLLWVGLRK